MNLERAGGWLLLLGGLVFLGELVLPKLKSFENMARLGVAGGAALFLVGHFL